MEQKNPIALEEFMGKLEKKINSGLEQLTSGQTVFIGYNHSLATNRINSITRFCEAATELMESFISLFDKKEKSLDLFTSEILPLITSAESNFELKKKYLQYIDANVMKLGVKESAAVDLYEYADYERKKIDETILLLDEMKSTKIVIPQDIEQYWDDKLACFTLGDTQRMEIKENAKIILTPAKLMEIVSLNLMTSGLNALTQLGFQFEDFAWQIEKSMLLRKHLVADKKNRKFEFNKDLYLDPALSIGITFQRKSPIAKPEELEIESE